MLLSGGIDSATCALLYRNKFALRAVTYAFDGIAEGEVNAAKAIGEAAKAVEHRFVRLPDIREAGDLKLAFKGLPPTFIPMRNPIFYSLAASYAFEVGAQQIIGGHNKDDVKKFPDARPEFFERLQRALRTASPRCGKKPRILTPLRNKTKPQVIRLASRIGVPFELTWSCHEEGSVPCWKCDGCTNRTVSFGRAGVRDPLR